MTQEDYLQIACMEYLRWKHPNTLVLHIPNGGFRNKIEAYKLKRMGVLAGAPDIFIPLEKGKITSKDDVYVTEYNGFFCELKIKPRKPTKKQLEIHEKLRELGYYVCVCYSIDEFIKEVENYLGKKHDQ
jgi:hypothetical protein